MQTLVIETYGGKIDNDDDFEELSGLVNRILTPAAFDDDHSLVESASREDGNTELEGSLRVPSGTSFQDFMQWVHSLPEREPPTYLGLPANAGKLLLVGHGRDTISKVARIAEILDEGRQTMGEEADTLG